MTVASTQHMLEVKRWRQPPVRCRAAVAGFSAPLAAAATPRPLPPAGMWDGIWVPAGGLVALGASPTSLIAPTGSMWGRNPCASDTPTTLASLALTLSYHIMRALLSLAVMCACACAVRAAGPCEFVSDGLCPQGKRYSGRGTRICGRRRPIVQRRLRVPPARRRRRCRSSTSFQPSRGCPPCCVLQTEAPPHPL